MTALLSVARPGGINAQEQSPSVGKYKDHNLVFVSFDALQAAHVSCLGYQRKVTPVIDAFAKDAFNFQRNYSVASWTVPASMTWFTGVYPSEHGMVNKYALYNDRVQKKAKLRETAPDLLTLAALLKANGYATGGFTGNAGVSGGFGYQDGFDTYYYPHARFGRFDESIPRALRWLEIHRDDKFFLFLHGYDCHGQSTPLGGYDHRYVNANYDGKYLGLEREQELLREEGLERGKLDLREQDVKFWRAIYDEKINRTDMKFGRFLKRYRDLGLEEKTLFVLTSDHGTEVYEHRRFDHGFTLYNELIHVPLIVRLPGSRQGRNIAERVSSIDLMPTILDLLEIDVPESAARRLRGRSLRAVIEGRGQPRDIISETDYREYTFKRSLISPDGWKLIYTLETRTRELYNLNIDPRERRDLAATESARADRLQQRLFAHFRSLGHDLHSRRWQRGLNPVYPSQAK